VAIIPVRSLRIDSIRLASLTTPGVSIMSYRCEICGKEPSYGKSVSFSHKRNNRRWLPNIQKIRVKHGSNTRRARVCTSCIRAGKVVKA
jgi:large subunit ribosomal protein L28